jgi:hypothetical protein
MPVQTILRDGSSIPSNLRSFDPVAASVSVTYNGVELDHATCEVLNDD